MERKIFNTLVKRKGITSIEIQNGYELEIAGRKFYGYMNEDQRVYIIDPRNGLAIIACDYDFVDYDESTAQEVMEDEVHCITAAAKKAIDRGIIEKLKKEEKKRSYKLTIKIFKAFMKAETLMAKREAAALKEHQAEGEAERGDT